MPRSCVKRYLPLTNRKQIHTRGSKVYIDFISEFASFIRPTMQCRKFEANILATAFCDFLKRIVTDSNKIVIPHFGTFEKIREDEIRFYPDENLREKFNVVNEHRGKSTKLYKRKKSSKKTKALGLTRTRD